MKKSLLISVALLLLFVSGYAQEKIISGKVTSAEDGAPSPGVSVVVKGTTIGTSTDNDGDYTISVPSGSNTLVFSFIGLKSSEVEVGSRTIIDVRLAQDVTQLSEVVVVGYGTQIKQELTGNIAHVTGKDIQNLPVQSFEQAVQGRAAGVFVETGNGKLGQGVKVRIRGSSSVSAGNQPLYVVDGIPITSANQASANGDTNPLTDINPSDIESIEILKDASAAAIYGSRAANGVMLITTKRGKSGKTKFALGYQSGVSTATRRKDFLNTAEYVELFQEARANGVALGTTTTSEASLFSRFDRYAAGSRPAWQDPGSPEYTNTNWQDQIFQDGHFNQFDLSANGGSEKTRFFASLSRSDQNGILVGNKLDRMSARINVDHQASEKLSLGINFNITRTNNFRLSDDNLFSTPMQVVALAPMTPVVDPRTNLTSGALDLNTGSPNSNFPTYYNPLLDNVYSNRKTTVFRNFGTLFGEFKFNDAFSFRSEGGFDLLNQHEFRFFGKETSRNTGAPNGSGTDAYTQVFNYTTNNFLRFSKSFNENSTIEAIGGMSFQQSLRNFSNIEAQEFPSNSYKQITSAANVTTGVSEETEFSFLSYFARANFKFKGKYLLGMSGRVDGSSRFGEGNKYGFFPAASAGWLISEESFLANNSTLSFLKLRASYGLTGNAEIANFSSLGLFTASAYGGFAGQRPTQLPNPDLKWEQTAQLDIGFDFGFFNDRLSGEVDYYIKKTNDLLLNVNLPGSSGFDTQIQNIGELENKGLEFVVNSSNLIGVFKWNTSFNIAANRNKITNLQDQIIQGDFLSRAVEGEPIGIFFGPQYAGVDPANGDALYYIQNSDGTTTTSNDYNSATFMKIGNPNPDYIAGITNTFSYKGIDLSLLFQGVFGNEVYNGGGKFMSANGDFFDNQTKDQLERWQNPGDITDVPQARLLGGNGIGESSRYVSDGSYVRLKTATLGYNLPAALISKAYLSNVRVYLSAQNLLTITDYKGWDPEVNADSFADNNVNQGIDFYSAPQPRTITFGINIGF
jgi:TonB-linked SusC/RagA family outer membrane protein